jgi:hypothetical protein
VLVSSLVLARAMVVALIDLFASVVRVASLY